MPVWRKTWGVIFANFWVFRFYQVLSLKKQTLENYGLSVVNLSTRRRLKIQHSLWMVPYVGRNKLMWNDNFTILIIGRGDNPLLLYFNSAREKSYIKWWPVTDASFPSYLSVRFIILIFFLQGVIHKACGQNFGYFDPTPPFVVTFTK